MAMTETLGGGAADAQAGLARRKAGGRAAPAEIIAQAAKAGGAGPFRQFAEALSLMRRVSFRDYYANELYRRDMTAAQKRAFRGEVGIYRLNQRLSPPALTQMRGFFNDKLAFAAALTQLGVPTVRDRAGYAAARGLGRLRTLRSADEIAAYLRDEAAFPLFGKPIDGLQALGSVSLAGREGERLWLANGDTMEIGALAAEIAASYPGGFLFQDRIDQHPEIVALAGPAVGTLRVVTAMAGDEPEVVYAVWKLPGPQAMADNFWQAGSMIALPDLGTGEVVRCRQGTGPATRWLDAHPVTGVALPGFRIPFFREALELGRSTHAIFPTNGILGWDIAIAADGPLIVEGNESPAHQLWQFATGKGIAGPEFAELFARVEARNLAAARAISDKAVRYRREL